MAAASPERRAAKRRKTRNNVCKKAFLVIRSNINSIIIIPCIFPSILLVCRFGWLLCHALMFSIISARNHRDSPLNVERIRRKPNVYVLCAPLISLQNVCVHKNLSQSNNWISNWHSWNRQNNHGKKEIFFLQQQQVRRSHIARILFIFAIWKFFACPSHILRPFKKNHQCWVIFRCGRWILSSFLLTGCDPLCTVRAGCTLAVDTFLLRQRLGHMISLHYTFDWKPSTDISAEIDFQSKNTKICQYWIYGHVLCRISPRLSRNADENKVKWPANRAYFSCRTRDERTTTKHSTPYKCAAAAATACKCTDGRKWKRNCAVRGTQDTKNAPSLRRSDRNQPQKCHAHLIMNVPELWSLFYRFISQLCVRPATTK